MRAPWIAVVLLLLAGTVAAKELPPPPDTYVLDEVGWLTGVQERALSDRLLEYERTTSNQIVVALFRSLEGEDLADYSQRLAEHWGIGQAEQSNGVLVVAYAQERLMSIEVGYGLEGAIPDAIAGRIRTETLVPAFRQQRYYQGLSAAVDQLMAAARGEFQGTGRARGDRRRDTAPVPIGVFVVFMVIVALSRIVGGGLTGSANYGGRRRGGWYVGPTGFGGGRRGGGFGGGGFGGGGFSGGGGSFGGGGARGGW